ncbi:Uu.00g028630.m01.CDS01 [Anthostomella pinea]|uniref:Uu.00g028630.m01.CDS01 n=1 Tax=Anthostomella pinea TaxID=933095 RepID=A0AAI8YCS2_9PEZI|nr:Uu.00g028630.m01.CDS01 [Anthostomella pinea]
MQSYKGSLPCKVREAIKAIPKPERIRKVVCIGLGSFALPSTGTLGPSPENRRDERPIPGPKDAPALNPGGLIQHVLAISTVKQLYELTGKTPQLYAADPGYTQPHKEALENLSNVKFKILDPSYGFHEQFVEIDDSTMVISILPQSPVELLVSEYARPVAMIRTNGWTRGPPFSEKKDPDEDMYWYEAEVGEPDGQTMKTPGCRWLDMPRRVHAMISTDYKLCEKFPVEAPANDNGDGYDLLSNIEHGHYRDVRADGYWKSYTHMYVRKY